jgi:hypothetical protein
VSGILGLDLDLRYVWYCMYFVIPEYAASLFRLIHHPAEIIQSRSTNHTLSR